MSKIKIFFGGSITGGLDDAELYQQIIEELKKYGTVLTEHNESNEELKQLMEGFRNMLKKIYFAGSIRGGRDDAELYARIIQHLQEYGTVLTEHVGDKNVDKSEKDLDDKAIHDRDMDWLTQCDALVAEVTQTSLGVGYEIGRAVAMNKKILCLFRPDSGKRLSAMIAGADNGENFIVKHYKEQDIPSILKEFFQKQ